MNCDECTMRYICDAVLGGKDKCAYEIHMPIVGGTSDENEDENDNS